MPSNDQIIESLTVWVEELSARVNAQTHVIEALVVTHPDRKLLMETMKHGLPEADAMLNGSSLPDYAISAFQEVIDRMIGLAEDGDTGN